MSTSPLTRSSNTGWMGRSSRRVVEFAYWVVAVSLTVSTLLLILGSLAGGLRIAKILLFVVGALFFGIGSLGMQPKAPYKDRKRVTLEGADEYRFESVIQRIPPLRNRRQPLSDRVSRDVKLFVAGVVILGLSAFLEFGLGVRV